MSLLLFFFGFDLVTAAETLDPAGGIDKFLFAGKKGMTPGTDANPGFLARGLGFPNFSAGADNFGGAVGRVQVLFHVQLKFLN
jgi:hypothetical protein